MNLRFLLIGLVWSLPLARALAHWDGLIRVTEPIYAEMPLAQIHKVNRTFPWKILRPQVVRDLELAKQD